MEKTIVKTLKYMANSHRYKTDAGIISLVKNGSTYEIYCIEGNLFSGIEKFRTIEASEKRISSLLED